MKKVISVVAVLVMIGALCAGCKDKEADRPKPGTTNQSKESNDKNWEPETAKQPTTRATKGSHDPNVGDHSGHNH